MRLRRVHGGRGTAFGAVAAALISALSLALPASAEAQGSSSFVTRSGTQLRLDGQAYRFTGINIYNANNASGCWYPLSNGPDLGASLDAIGGGAKVIRAWFFQALATNAGVRDWSGIDHTLSVAVAHGVRVIATLGNQWIHCDGPAGGAGSYKDDAWYTNGYKQPDPAGTASYRDWVAAIVARYKNNPTILAWQLMNEAEVKPSEGSTSCSLNAEQTLKAFATDVSGLVKSIDSNHLVSLGTIGGGQCGAQGDEYQDLHDIPTIDLCEYHDYGSPTVPMPGDQFNGLQRRLTQCDALGKPLFVGETGIRPNDVPSNVQPNFPLYDRANAFEAKFRAQFAAGVVGELVWAWDKDGSKEDDYDIGPGDQTLRTLTVWNSPSSGTIDRASVSATGTQGDKRSTLPYITPDGRYVLFSSEANNLTPADTQGSSNCGRLDVFLKDRQTGSISLVSVDSAGQPLGGFCGNDGFGVSANGDRILLQTDAYRSPSGTFVGSDILVRDRAAGTTRNLTAGANGGTNSNGFLTSNGRYAVFTSDASNLVPGTQSCPFRLRMYLYDLSTDAVSLVSPDEAGNQCAGNGANLAAVSEDGRYVAFQTDADLAPEDVSQFRDLDVYLLDRQTGAVTLVSKESTGVAAAAFDPSISGDGNFVAYVSENANIVPGDTNGPGGNQRGWDVFVWDRVHDTTERVSVDSSGHELESSFRPHLSARGRFVAFASGHSPIGSGDPSGYFDVYVRDRDAGTTERILGQAGVPGGRFTDLPRLSPTGRFIVFPSSGTTYVAGDANNTEDVFVHERSGPVEQPLGGNDVNGDGIADSLQPAGTPAGSFSNGVQGKANPTIGTVVSGSVTVEDVADPTKGVRITATSDAVLTVCGGFELDLAAGGAATITCSSVSVENITGAPATVKAGGASVVFPTGTAGTVGTVGGLTVTGVSGSGVTLTVGGVQAPVPTGDSKLIQGNVGNTVLNGSAGNDLILDAGGNNTIDGKGGDDTIVVNGTGNNTIKGGTGTDTITTGSGNDAIDGGDGNDKINAGNGNNTITGGTGNDSLRAGTGNDTIDGGTGTDLCTPGSGKNTVKNCEGTLT